MFKHCNNFFFYFFKKNSVWQAEESQDKPTALISKLLAVIQGSLAQDNQGSSGSVDSSGVMPQDLVEYSGVIICC